MQGLFFNFGWFYIAKYKEARERLSNFSKADKFTKKLIKTLIVILKLFIDR
jgi:hypothetical protein